MRAYNATALELAGTEPFIDVEHGMLVPPGNKVFYPYHWAHIESVMETWPHHAKVGLDIEGSLKARAESRLPEFVHKESPSTAVKWRRQLVAGIKQRRPDLDVGLWKTISSYRREFFAPHAFAKATRRDADYYAAGKLCDTIYVTNYWFFDDAESTVNFERWGNALRVMCAMSQVIYGVMPAVYFSGQTAQKRGLNWLSPDVFYSCMDLMRRLELDVVYWLQNDQTDVPGYQREMLLAYSFWT